MCFNFQRLTWAVLKAAGTPRHKPRNKHVARDTGFNTDNYKDRVNTLLLVATLVATVTFALVSPCPVATLVMLVIWEWQIW